MTIHVNELINLLAELSENKNIRSTAVQSAKGGLITCASAIIGGLLLGRVGVALGAAFGGLGAACISDDFQSLPSILRGMSQTQKQRLANHLVKAFCDFGVDDVVSLIILLNGNASVVDLALKETKNYLNGATFMKTS